MKIKLKSRLESIPVNSIPIYNKAGFKVKKNGFFENGNRKIEIDTNKQGSQYQGLSRRALIDKIKEKFGCPVVAGGNNWDILNDR